VLLDNLYLFIIGSSLRVVDRKYAHEVVRWVRLGTAHKTYLRKMHGTFPRRSLISNVSIHHQDKPIK